MTEPQPITVPAPSGVVLIGVCVHCGKPHAHTMAHRPPQYNEALRMAAIEALPDATAWTCTGCWENYAVTFATPFVPLDLVSHIREQWAWSVDTFGPGDRTAGVLEHIRRELLEIEAAPHDTEEWVDVMMLAIDGAMRNGATPESFAAALRDKLEKNRKREWPDWRTVPTDQPTLHIKQAGDPLYDRDSWIQDNTLVNTEAGPLDAELDAILKSVPSHLRVIVQEGGGPVNLVASLAASVAKMAAPYPPDVEVAALFDIVAVVDTCPACGQTGVDEVVPEEFHGSGRRCPRCLYLWDARQRIRDLEEGGRKAVRLPGSLTPLNCGQCDHPMAMFVKCSSKPDPERPGIQIISWRARHAVRCVKCGYRGLYEIASLFVFTRHIGPADETLELTPARNRLPDDFYI